MSEENREDPDVLDEISRITKEFIVRPHGEEVAELLLGEQSWKAFAPISYRIRKERHEVEA